MGVVWHVDTGLCDAGGCRSLGNRSADFLNTVLRSLRRPSDPIWMGSSCVERRTVLAEDLIHHWSPTKNDPKCVPAPAHSAIAGIRLRRGSERRRIRVVFFGVPRREWGTLPGQAYLWTPRGAKAPLASCKNMQRSRDMTLRSLGLRKAILFSSLAVLLAFAVYRAAWDVPSPIKIPNTAGRVAVTEN